MAPIYKMKIEQLGIKTEVKHLRVGDFWIGDCIIERKKIDDFFRSINDKSYYKQLYNMKGNSKRSMVYIIGMYPVRPPVRCIFKHGKRQFIPIDVVKAIRVHRAVSYYSFGIPVFQVYSDDDFIKELVEFYNKSGKTEPSLKPLDVKRKMESVVDIRINMYGSIPGIGAKAANYLGKKYTIPKISSMSIDKLRDIKVGTRKLGKKADKLYEVFNS